MSVVNDFLAHLASLQDEPEPTAAGMTREQLEETYGDMRAMWSVPATIWEEALAYRGWMPEWKLFGTYGLQGVRWKENPDDLRERLEKVGLQCALIERKGGDLFVDLVLLENFEPTGKWTVCGFPANEVRVTPEADGTWVHRQMVVFENASDAVFFRLSM